MEYSNDVVEFKVYALVEFELKLEFYPRLGEAVVVETHTLDIKIKEVIKL